MSRSFLVGLVWGLVVCGAGLAVISQMAPLDPQRSVVLAPATVAKPVVAPEAQNPPVAAATSTKAVVVEGDTAQEAVKPRAEPAETAKGQVDLNPPKVGAGETIPTPSPTTPMDTQPDMATAPLVEPATAKPDPAGSTAAGPAPAEPAPAVPATAESATAEPATVESSTADPTPDPVATAPKVASVVDTDPMAPEPDATSTAPQADLAPALPQIKPQAPIAPLADLAPVPDAATMPAPRQDTLLDPPASDLAPSTDAAPTMPGADDSADTPEVVILPDPDAPDPDAPDLDAPDPGQTTNSEAAGRVELGQATLPAAPPLKDAAGVTTNRLPRIGDAPKSLAGAGASDAATPTPPIVAFARPFTPEPGKPAFAILLSDIGAAGMARADLAKLPFPVTFVIDPAAPDAAQAMAAYRAAGQEVVMQAALPAKANPADLEQSFQAMDLALPEAVAVLDMRDGGLQENRVLATQAIPILKSQGRGIVTFDRGLDAADQVARREGLASAMIFRDLDAEGEDTPVIRRYLDRAAFKAAQEGRVVVIGQTRAETVAAILEWMVEGRGATVQLAPLTAVMQGGQ